jgi:hypothetical protein
MPALGHSRRSPAGRPAWRAHRAAARWSDRDTDPESGPGPATPTTPCSGHIIPYPPPRRTAAALNRRYAAPISVRRDAVYAAPSQLIRAPLRLCGWLSVHPPPTQPVTSQASQGRRRYGGGHAARRRAGGGSCQRSETRSWANSSTVIRARPRASASVATSASRLGSPGPCPGSEPEQGG